MPDTAAEFTAALIGSLWAYYMYLRTQLLAERVRRWIAGQEDS